MVLTLDDVTDAMKTHQATLFIGAGCSMGIGGPSGYELLNEVKMKFNDVTYRNQNDFFEVCRDIIQTHSRGELEDFIKKELGGLYPNKDHYELVKLPWKCMFTTNYDTVIEQIPHDVSKNRLVRPVKENDPKIELKRTDILYYIKILGSIDASYGEEGIPVLSKSEYNNSFLRTRRFYYNILADCIREGPLIFIGYSFQDYLVFDIMDELEEYIGPKVIRPSYAIMPEKPSDDILKLFARYKINYINSSFSNFIKHTTTIFENQIYNPIQSEKTMYIYGYPIEIPTTIERATAENFTFLNSSLLESELDGIKFFFNCEDTSFHPYKKKWDFEREVYSFNKAENPLFCQKYGPKVRDCLKNHMFKYAEDPQSENSITILTGPAGCGKTVILNRLAYDWYMSGLPVILMKPQGGIIDYRQVDKFIEFITIKYSENTRKNKKPKPRVLIICDKAASWYSQYLDLFDHLDSRGRVISMIIADRDNLLANKNLSAYIKYSMPESLNQAEIDNFEEYLLSNKIIDGYEDISHTISNKGINSSFFALMYTIINESKKPLAEIIRDQYLKLTDWPKQIYEYVCLFNYYNINPNEELLVRTTTNSSQIFRSEVENGQLKKVIFKEAAEYNNIDYRVHHPIIASKTVSMFLHDPSIRVQKFYEVLSKLNPNLNHEFNKMDQFVKQIGPNSDENEIPIELKKEIFKLISSQLKSRTIYHQYALLELSDNEIDFDFAESLLKKALRIRDNGEIDEHLYTSLGKLYTKKGYYLEDHGKPDEALESYEKAEKNFIKGRSLNFKNSYSYHGQISLNRRRAEKASNSIEKVKFYSKAMDLCDDALSNLSKSQHEEIIEQQAMIAASLGYFEDFDAIVEVLANEYNSAAGYLLKARILYKESFEAIDEIDKYDKLDQAYNLVARGYEVDYDNVKLHGLKAKIGIELFPDDIDNLYNLLKKWYDYSDQDDLYLLLNYGIILFKKKFYIDSKDVFDKLNYLSQGVVNRSSVKEISFIMENGEKKHFYGEVASIDPSGSKGTIKCTSIQNLTYNLNFSPFRSNFTPRTGDHVIFNIGFNMRGIYAYDCRKN